MGRVMDDHHTAIDGRRTDRFSPAFGTEIRSSGWNTNLFSVMKAALQGYSLTTEELISKAKSWEFPSLSTPMDPLSENERNYVLLVLSIFGSARMVFCPTKVELSEHRSTILSRLVEEREKIVFLPSDSVFPSNEGRRYLLRLDENSSFSQILPSESSPSS